MFDVLKVIKYESERDYYRLENGTDVLEGTADKIVAKLKLIQPENINLLRDIDD